MEKFEGWGSPSNQYEVINQLTIGLRPWECGAKADFKVTIWPQCKAF